MTPPLDLFQVRTVRIQQYDRGQQAYVKHEAIDSHGLTDAREIADWQGGWLQAEESAQAVAYWAGVREEAMSKARGLPC